MQMSGSREIHAPFSPDQLAGVAPPTGLGSAHRASVIQIFAYAGYKRDVDGRFVLLGSGSRVWMEALLFVLILFFSSSFLWLVCGWKLLFILVLVFVLVLFFSSSWLGVLARAGGPSSLSFVGRSSSARESAHPSLLSSMTRRGEPGAGAISPWSRYCAGETERAPFCHHPVRTSGPRRDDAEREVATPFLFFFIWVLCKRLWEGACGIEVKLYKCCRVSRSRDKSFVCYLCI